MCEALTRARIFVVALACSAVGCGGDVSGEDVEGTRLGAVLPFTGATAASGANIERALLLAVEEINAAGGAGGQPVALITEDSHSSVERGLDSVRSLIEDRGVVSLIGPAQGELLQEMLGVVEERRIPLVSGSTTSIPSTEDDGFAFTTAPTATDLAEALATRVYTDGVGKVAILHENSEYGSSFAQAVEAEILRRDGEVTTVKSFNAGGGGYGPVLQDIAEGAPDAIVLVAYPLAGASIVLERAISYERTQWYLAPTLNAEQFFQNVPPQVLDGAVGVSPAVGGDGDTFARVFSERWRGEQPLAAAYFFYDAAMLWALAYEAAYVDIGAAPNAATVRDFVDDISQSPGERIPWDSIDEALALVREGAPVDYCGASGFVDLDAEGDIRTPLFEFWTVEDNEPNPEPVGAPPVCRVSGL